MIPRSIRWPTLLLVLACAPLTAGATSYAPTPREVYSGDGRFVLEVEPASGKHHVHAVGDRARPVWQLERPAGMDHFFLGDGGRSVLVVTWEYCGVNRLDASGVELWTPQGLSRTLSVRELVAQPSRVRGIGPIGSFWREWHRRTYNLGPLVTIVTTGPWRYELSTATGEIVDRHVSLLGLAPHVAGYLCFALGALLLVRLVRGPRDAALLRVCLLCGLLAGGLYLAGLPPLPAELAARAYPVLAVAWLASLPLALFQLVRSRHHLGWRLAPFGLGLLLLPALYGLFMLSW